VAHKFVVQTIEEGKSNSSKDWSTVSEQNVDKKENSPQHYEAKRKPKRQRVPQRKELAVVTVGMIAAITSFGGLLAGNQAHATQAADATPPAQVSSATPGSSSEQSPKEQASAEQAPAYSPATQDAPVHTPHAQSQGS